MQMRILEKFTVSPHYGVVAKPGFAPIDGFIRVTVVTAAERALFFENFTAALETLRERVS